VLCGLPHDRTLRANLRRAWRGLHRVPPRDQPGQRITLNDLRLLCANCHRMLHRPWITVGALRQLLSSVKS